MKSKAMTNTATRRPRVIVYSNFPKQHFEKTIQPKLQAAGVDVHRVINVDRSESVDFSSADAIIAFVELMSSMQRDSIKAKAKMAGRRFFGFTRQASTWPAALSTIQIIPEATPSNVRRIVPPPRPALVEEAPPSLPIPDTTVEDLRAMLKLFEEENDELNKAKAAYDKTIKEREDRVVHFAKHFEEEKAKVVELENRLKEQINIRAQLESDLHLAKEAVDALERQLSQLKREPPEPPQVVEVENTRSIAALRAHNTRLKRDLFDAQEEIKRLAALGGQAPSSSTAMVVHQEAPAFDKQILVEWLVVLRKADYRGALELAAKYGVDAATILELLK